MALGCFRPVFKKKLKSRSVSFNSLRPRQKSTVLTTSIGSPSANFGVLTRAR